jgi:hypothetical protein
MIRYQHSTTRGKGTWKLHLYDRSLTVQDGVVEFEAEPPEHVKMALTREGFDRIPDGGNAQPIRTDNA